jgi:hypothetical protein
MRDLARNRIKIRYRLYIKKEEIKDELGCLTGEYKMIYSDIMNEINISVSANKGDYSVQQFGNMLDYDRTMLISDPDCPIDENTRVYIGGSVYIVKAAARSINGVQYAIKRTEVNDGANDKG